MSRSNKTDSDLLTGLWREAITKRQSGVGRTFYLLSADYIDRKVVTHSFPKVLALSVPVFWESDGRTATIRLTKKLLSDATKSHP